MLSEHPFKTLDGVVIRFHLCLVLGLNLGDVIFGLEVQLNVVPQRGFQLERFTH